MRSDWHDPAQSRERQLGHYTSLSLSLSPSPPLSLDLILFVLHILSLSVSISLSLLSISLLLLHTLLQSASPVAYEIWSRRNSLIIQVLTINQVIVFQYCGYRLIDQIRHCNTRMFNLDLLKWTRRLKPFSDMNSRKCLDNWVGTFSELT